MYMIDLDGLILFYSLCKNKSIWGSGISIGFGLLLTFNSASLGRIDLLFFL
jgi:hypothetical protein